MQVWGLQFGVIVMTNQSMFSKSYMTKLRIAEAMNRLCENTPLKKIRIEDIVAESGVSRSNFYHNFDDKYAVITWLGEVCHENGIFRIGRDLTWYEGHLNTTRDMNRFKCLFVSAGAGSDYDSPVPHFVRKRQDNLRETILEYQRMELTEELEFQICALPHCEAAMTGMFRRGELTYDTETFCRLMTEFTPRELYHALEHPAMPAHTRMYSDERLDEIKPL